MEAALPACPTCGAPSAAEARFCSACGTPLAAPHEQALRRVVTALFADVEGSTSLGERMDPEDFGALLGEGVARMGTVVDALGGTVEHLAGDGLLALFGAPVAHEDDAERAVLAGLRIVEDLGAYAADAAPRWGIAPFRVRVGVETGLVVVGSVGVGRAVHSSAMGDAVNTAARLQAAAAPGTVLVGERTRRLLERRFAWGETRTFELKGKSLPVAAAEPQPLPEAGGLAAAGLEADLVGRDTELAAALGALRRLREGSGGVLIVTGEAGIGKSRLLREVRRRAATGSPAPLWLETRCASYDQEQPYLPLRALLRGWLELLRDAPPTAVARALDERLSTLGAGAQPELRTRLATLLGLPPVAVAAGPVAPPQEIRRRAAGALGTVLRRVASERPVVVCVDDVQWADRSSAEILGQLLGLSAHAPVLLALARRSGEGGEDDGDALLAAASDPALGATRVTLAPLAGDADRRLLLALAGAALPAGLVAEVLERAEGNPFFLQELVRALLDAGALVGQATGRRFDPTTPVDVPPTLERLVLARIDRLSAPARAALGAGAVLGRRFTASLLAATMGGEPDLDGRLQELERHDLLRPGAGAAEPEYRFRHWLIHETAYHGLLKRTRAALHRNAAAALEAVAPEEHAVLARHHAAAGEAERALECYLAAAAAALALDAFEEAVGQADRGVEQAGLAGLAAGDERLVRLLAVRGAGRARGGDLDAGLADVERALAGAVTLGDPRLELECLEQHALMRFRDLDVAVERQRRALRIARTLGDMTAEVRTRARLSIILANRLRLDLAVLHGEHALALAESTGEERLEALGLDALKLVAWQLGDLARLEELCERLTAIHRRHDERWFQSFTILEAALVPLARARWDDAEARLDEAFALHESVDRYTRPLFLDARCWLERSRGELGRALEVGHAAHGFAVELDSTELVAWTAATLGWALLDARAPGAAAEVLETGLGAAGRAGAQAQELRCAALLAGARSRLGEPVAARAAAERAESVLVAVRTPPGEALLSGAHAIAALARVRLDGGDPDGAAALVSPVLAAAERSGWLEAAAQAAAVLARAELARARPQAAERLARRASEAAAHGAIPAAEADGRVVLALALGALRRESEAAAEAARARALAAQLAGTLPEVAAGRRLPAGVEAELA